MGYEHSSCRISVDITRTLLERGGLCRLFDVIRVFRSKEIDEYDGSMGLRFVLEFTSELNYFPHITRLADLPMSFKQNL